MIYKTIFNTDTSEVVGYSTPSNFKNFNEVLKEFGAPLNQGKRSVTYRGLFFSDYVVKAAPVTVSFL